MTAAILPFPSQLKKKPSRAGARFLAMQHIATHERLAQEVQDRDRALQSDLAADLDPILASYVAWLQRDTGALF